MSTPQMKKLEGKSLGRSQDSERKDASYGAAKVVLRMTTSHKGLRFFCTRQPVAALLL